MTRPNTGEDWSEKIAAELAKALKLPHADYELGTFNDSAPCVLSPNFVPKGCTLIHGNELLGRVDSSYGENVSRFQQTTHTVDGIFVALEQSDCDLPLNWSPPNGITTASDVFTGYLFLDALIGNTDRHDENWGIIQAPEEATARRHLAPTYDHAASLGFHLQDNNRIERLSSKDRGFQVEAYADKAISALYGSSNDSKPLSTLLAFQTAAEKRPQAAQVWMRLLRNLNEERLKEILNEVPANRFSEESGKFARRMLLHNRDRLLILA